ncbi:hypothetical protein SCG7086_AC_00030 [Chlamydiales bacterium SCGC AG-110-P3]|nr:hypothetical protein SCG7086_AC_00030 [Chlamydiales bacterium SCGC AG-110-P3]
MDIKVSNTSKYNSSSSALLRKAALDSLPVFMAYFPLGVVWGVLWEQAGLPPIWGVVYSLSIYAGAIQFVTLSLIAADTSIWGLLVAAIPLAIRNSFYTITASQRLPCSWLSRLYAAFGLVDAPFAILMSKSEEQARNPWYSISLTIIIQIYWVIGTCLGVYCGGYIPNGIASLDFALPALLAVLALDQAHKIGSWKPVAVAISATAVTWLLLGHAWLISALIICTASAMIASNGRSS